MPPSLNRRMSPSFNHSNRRNINEENVNLDETEITEEDSLFKSDYTEISMEPCGSANLKAMEVAKEAGALLSSFKALKIVGVEGVMVDVWWGLVEEVVGKYNWGGYAELFDMAKSYGLKVQAVMSCHQCGGTVGDSCLIPLPKWVVEEIDKDPDLAYTDQWGRRNYEYLSLGCDTIPCLKGRTPVQFNSDYMRAFKHKFSHLLGDTIMELQVGMVPAGELRYPSYPEKDGIWKFPGIEAFQCYEKFESRS